MNKIKKTKAVLLDLDGTVYLEDTLIGEVENTLNLLREKSIKIVYLSNNSSKTSAQYLEKLKRLNVYREGDIFYSSLDATIDYFKDNYANSKVFAIANQKVCEELVKKGITLDKNAEIVLLCYDNELTYEKLCVANKLIVQGATYIATHPDKTCPAKEVFVPDVGSFIELLKTSSGKEPQVIIGKPNKIMANYLIKMLGLKNDEITMVGDRLYTDIAFGVNNHFNTALVLSGETSFEQAKKSSVKPDIILSDINEIIKYL